MSDRDIYKAKLTYAIYAISIIGMCILILILKLTEK